MDPRIILGIKICATLLVTLIISLIERKIYHKLGPKLKEKHRVWEYSILHSLHAPLQIFIWLYGIAFAADFAVLAFGIEHTDKVIGPLKRVVGILLVFWFFASFIRVVERNLMQASEDGKKKHLDKTTIRAIGQILRIVVIFGGIILLLQSLFDIPVSGLMAFAGGGGITIGFAAKDMLSNFFGGLMIFLDRPFEIGDWIHIPEKDLEGDILHIGWRLTHMRTFDKRPVYIPNSLFLTCLVENPTRMTHRRLKSYVGVRYDDAKKMRKIIDEIRQMLTDHPDIDNNMNTYVNFYNFTPSALEIYVAAYTRKTRRLLFLPVHEDVNLKIIDIINDNGAQLAFPTTTVHVPDGINTK